MIDQAQKYADQDKKRREEAEKLNVANSVCYQAERMLADFGSKLSDDMRRRVETALREAREALSKRDVLLASQKADALKVVLQEAGQLCMPRRRNPARSPALTWGRRPARRGRPVPAPAAAWSMRNTGKLAATRDRARL